LTAAACGGFAAECPAGRRYGLIASGAGTVCLLQTLCAAGAALGGKCGQCHVSNRRRMLNTDLYRLYARSAVGVGSPFVWVWGGYGDRNSVPTAALDSSVDMAIPMGMGMGIEIPSPRQPWTLPWIWGSPWVWGLKFRPHDSPGLFRGYGDPHGYGD